MFRLSSLAIKNTAAFIASIEKYTTLNPSLLQDISESNFPIKTSQVNYPYNPKDSAAVLSDTHNLVIDMNTLKMFLAMFRNEVIYSTFSDMVFYAYYLCDLTTLYELIN